MRSYRAVIARNKEKTRRFQPSRIVVAVTGIDDYQYLAKLNNAVNDAKGILQVFTENFAAITPFQPLLNKDATKANINGLIIDDLRAFLKPTDALIYFFAGHGITRRDKVGGRHIETGYIVPVDARKDVYSDFINIELLLDELSRLPAQHILTIFDACHSGFALGKSVKSYRSISRYTNDLLKRVSRRVLTSARGDQLAIDNGPIPNHSLFTGTLIKGLTSKKVDIDNNGFVTISELSLYVQQRVAQYSNAQQTPDFGAFHLDDRGELVLPLYVPF